MFKVLFVSCLLLMKDYLGKNIFISIFIVRSMYSYFSATLTEVLPCVFLSCKANSRV